MGRIMICLLICFLNDCLTCLGTPGISQSSRFTQYDISDFSACVALCVY